MCRTREAVAAKSRVLSELMRHDSLISDLTFQNVIIKINVDTFVSYFSNVYWMCIKGIK